MKNKYFILSAFLLLAFPALSQTKHYSKLEIKSKEVFEVGPDNMLVVDTLIMHDKSTIKFSPETLGILKAKVVSVGKNCTISSRGEKGEDAKSALPDKPDLHGTPGQNGGNLQLDMHFASLGSLTIDSRGGKGGDGYDGKNGKRGTADQMSTKSEKSSGGKAINVPYMILGVPGTNGTNATSGRSGGNGGDIQLTYSTADFIPIFNIFDSPNRNNSIYMLYSAGEMGRNGKPGKGGINSWDGELVLIDKQTAVDGTVKLLKEDDASVRDN
ncbi:hypothetical protein [Pontibacter akesuensis]|uniref:Collagen triple helix repeat-containing protein n=1 Tax=Pontibacter akesuensis TaxID=388950 RepID=A0A1I7JYL1_9BACT|nr:hypothetical protein [Pontibacter akesuensis]GHA76513.1 hypothetical protein GCM10007389_33090 [Pontibacter akesuensis]SFU90266.1 hypothetical protein SAMN04487941_3193 [Pontibacter akesuensis]